MLVLSRYVGQEVEINIPGFEICYVRVLKLNRKNTYPEIVLGFDFNKTIQIERPEAVKKTDGGQQATTEERKQP